jgi:mRNA interferase HigB
MERMQLTGQPKLRDFQSTYRAAAKWIDVWVADVRKSTWHGPVDVKRIYPRASILPLNVYIFDVKGNKYRLETQIDFPAQLVHALWVGTHEEYTRRNRHRS